ncbi:MAG: CoA ester lyase [Betaproteobacteria bacterium]
MSASAAPAGALARSYLFVPGMRPERFGKAVASGAHAVIVDLEDAVPPADKERARAAVAGALSPAQPVLVRINAAGTPWFDDDVSLCRHAGVAGVVLPKAEDAAVIARIRGGVGEAVAILPLVESAQGLWNVLALARAPGVARLLFGSIDYQVDLGLRDDELLHARSQLVLVSRVAGLPAPVDGVTTAIDDADAIRRDTDRARALGFGGKLCIHPKQVEFVNTAFRPTAGEVAWATRVVAADAAAGGAAVAVDGKMVDRPVLLKAREILAADRT